MDELVDIITLPNELDQASIANIVRNLYPAAQVSDDTLLKVIGALGHGQYKAAFPIQVLLLKWLVMVYKSVRNPKVFSHAYGFLFNLLDTIAIRYILQFTLVMPRANRQQSSPLPPVVVDYSSKTCEAVPNSSFVSKYGTVWNHLTYTA